MNDILQKFARDVLKTNLNYLDSAHHRIFRLMYSPYNLELDINLVVDDMPADKLDWAMQQVQNTIDKQQTGETTML